jgi:death on curing protein
MAQLGRKEPLWLEPELAFAIHDRQLAEHGGGVGVRDTGVMESALARPINKWSYGEDDLAVLAASYAFGLARNHPFVDGNKRTAWVLARLFLSLNGVTLRFEREEAIEFMLAVAAGHRTEEQVADWFRRHIVQP